MFMPDHFRVEDVAEMHALMRARPFAALVSVTPSGLYGTHLPTVLKDEGPNGTIECHLARANPHWKDLAKGEEAMMIFQGADGYITPNWYATKGADRQSRADLELRDRARLRAPGDHERQGLAQAPCHGALRPAGAQRGASMEGLRRAGKLHRRDAARDRRLPFRDHASRRQMEDEPEPRDAGSARRDRWPESARERRRSRDRRNCHRAR